MSPVSTVQWRMTPQNSTWCGQGQWKNVPFRFNFSKYDAVCNARPLVCLSSASTKSQLNYRFKSQRCMTKMMLTMLSTSSFIRSASDTVDTSKNNLLKTSLISFSLSKSFMFNVGSSGNFFHAFCLHLLIESRALSTHTLVFLTNELFLCYRLFIHTWRFCALHHWKLMFLKNSSSVGPVNSEGFPHIPTQQKSPMDRPLVDKDEQVPFQWTELGSSALFSL